MKCTLIELQLHDGSGGFDILRITTAPFDVQLNGNMYTSTGDLLSISSSEESDQMSKTGLTLQMNGINISFQAQLDNGGFIRAPIDIIHADVPEGTNVATSYLYYHRGYCDTPVSAIDYESGTISLAMETTNIFIDIDKTPSLLRSSLSNHRARHPGDLFFQYTADVDIEETWIEG